MNARTHSAYRGLRFEVGADGPEGLGEGVPGLRGCGYGPLATGLLGILGLGRGAMPCTDLAYAPWLGF